MPLKVEIKFHMRAKFELAEDKNTVRVTSVQSVYRKATMAGVWPTAECKSFHTKGTQVPQLSDFRFEILRETRNFYQKISR
jgi:hypothetical protein